MVGLIAIENGNKPEQEVPGTEPTVVESSTERESKGDFVIFADNIGSINPSFGKIIEIYASQAKRLFLNCQNPERDLVETLQAHEGNICLVILPGRFLGDVREAVSLIIEKNIPAIILTGDPDMVDKELAGNIPIVSKGYGGEWVDVVQEAIE